MPNNYPTVKEANASKALMQEYKEKVGGKGAMNLLTGEQEKLNSQLQNSAQQGSFQPAGDYYRGLMSDDSQDIADFQAPEIRRFNEQTIPGLSEQFAGMGAGGLSSSGFRNSGVQASTDLSERLAQIRANVRQGAAQGLMNLGQAGLNPTRENTYQQPAPSMWGPILGAAGTAAGAYFGGPGGAAAGNVVGNTAGNWIGEQTRSNNVYSQSNSIFGK